MIGDTILVVGGGDSGSPETHHATVDVYDPACSTRWRFTLRRCTAASAATCRPSRLTCATW